MQWEHSQQKFRELELEVLKHSQTSKQQSILQEKLALEKSRATDMEKKVNPQPSLCSRCVNPQQPYAAALPNDTCSLGFRTWMCVLVVFADLFCPGVVTECSVVTQLQSVCKCEK